MDFGFSDVGIFDKAYQRSILEVSGTLRLNGYAHFGTGARVLVAKGAELILGDNLANSAACQIICTKKISIGSQTIISWDTLIMDNDYHSLMNISDGTIKPKAKPITIGENCWLGARCMILKGAELADNTTVAAGTIVSGKFDKEDAVIAGNPAHIVKEGLRPVH